ncbi:hypothetical protein [Roseicyclus persicicus]|uniref:Uncharacterized protein n=1 Tax=Roseicyclus persicicus TaxID=2650661 RepID=A0A7X6GXW4_9RHOB|nr:hypothetical protein [Roseibacterium persicicum]NKX43654.1 hypothetical protein [Roseibacterium persicicum]
MPGLIRAAVALMLAAGPALADWTYDPATQRAQPADPVGPFLAVTCAAPFIDLTLEGHAPPEADTVFLLSIDDETWASGAVCRDGVCLMDVGPVPMARAIFAGLRAGETARVTDVNGAEIVTVPLAGARPAIVPVLDACPL